MLEVAGLWSSLRIPATAICGLERLMKAKIMLGFLLLVLGAVFGVARQFDGDPIPPCLPDRPCIPR